MEEIWKPVEFLNGRYEVSNSGKLRNTKTKRELKAPINSHGYKSVVMRPKETNGKAINVSIHKVVAKAFLGEKPDGYVINHKDGDKTNNTVENLEYVTPGENNRHALNTGLRKPANMKGLSPKGESHYNAKLTENEVREIRRIHNETGYGSRRIAKMFGVTCGCISKILANKSWKHIDN